jgi:hypothetical protein
MTLIISGDDLAFQIFQIRGTFQMRERSVIPSRSRGIERQARERRDM